MRADGRADRRAGVREGRGAAGIEYSFGYEAVPLEAGREGGDFGRRAPAGGPTPHPPPLRPREALQGSVHLAHRLGCHTRLRRREGRSRRILSTFRLIVTKNARHTSERFVLR